MMDQGVEHRAVEAVAFVVNPMSGGGGGDQLLLNIARMLRSRGVWVAAFETHREHGATPAVEAALDAGFEEIWVIGGDGTIRECLGAIVEADAILGPIPGGTSNRLVEVVGHAWTDPLGQAEWMLGQPVRRMDLGECNGELFTVRAGVGFEAEAAREVEDDKSGLGNFAYVVAGLRAARQIRRVPVRLLAGDEVLLEDEMLTTIFSNLPMRVLLRVPGLERANPTDGALHAIVIRDRPGVDVLWRWVTSWQEPPSEPKLVFEATAPEFRLEVKGGAEVHLDGEGLGGQERVTVRCRHCALRLRGLDLAAGTPGG